MVQISRSHMSHSTTPMLQHKVRPEFKLNVIRLANNFNQSYSPYTSVMCSSATYWPMVWGVHICHWVYIQQSWYLRKKCQLSDFATNKVHGRHLASFHTKHLRLAGTNDAAKCCNYLRLHKSKWTTWNDVNLRTYVRYPSHPQCRSLKRTPMHLRRTAEQRQPRDAELRPVRLRSRPRNSEPGLSGHECATWRTAHGPFSNRRKSVAQIFSNPQKKWKSKTAIVAVLDLTFLSCVGVAID